MTSKTKKNKRRILLLASALGGTVLVGTAAALVASCGDAAKPDTSGTTTPSTGSDNTGTSTTPGGTTTPGTSTTPGGTTTPGTSTTPSDTDTPTTTPESDQIPQYVLDSGSAVKLNAVDPTILASNPGRDALAISKQNARAADLNSVKQQNSDFFNVNSDTTYAAKLQDALSQTFVFTGGAETAPDWTTQKDTKNFVNLFEDNVRDLGADYSSKTGVLQTVSRFVINTAKDGMTLANLVDTTPQASLGGETYFQQKIGDLAPKTVVYQLSEADMIDPTGDFVDPVNDWIYAFNAATFIEDVLAMRDNTAQLVVVTPYGQSQELHDLFQKLKTQFMWGANHVYVQSEMTDEGTGVSLLSRVKFVDLGADTVQTGNVVASDGTTTPSIGTAASYSDAENAKARTIYNALATGVAGAPAYQNVTIDYGAADSTYADLDGERTSVSNGKAITDLWVKESVPGGQAATGLNSSASGKDTHLTSVYLALDNSTSPIADGSVLNWKVYYPELGLTISDDAVAHTSPTQADSVAATTADQFQAVSSYANWTNNEEIGLEIPYINSDYSATKTGSTDTQKTTNASAGQKVEITVSDPTTGTDYEVWSGVLADVESENYTENATASGNGTGNLVNQENWNKIGTGNAVWSESADNTTADSLADVAGTDSDLNTLDGVQLASQEAFLKKFNDTSKPLKWLFLGSTTDQRSGNNADGTLGFNNYAQAIEKSVKGEWGRTDDVFIDATMVGDFTNRAIDTNLIKERINKYQADVVVLSYGLTEMMNNAGGADAVFSPENIPFGDTNPYKVSGLSYAPFEENMKTLITAINQNDASTPTARTGDDAPVILVNPVLPTLSTQKGLAGYNESKSPTTISSSAFGAPSNSQLAGTAAFGNMALQAMFGADGSKTSSVSSNLIYNTTEWALIKGIYADYQEWIGDSGLFMSNNVLAGPNVHLLQARSILSSLGVNVTNSYLNDYLLTKVTGVGASAPANIAGTDEAEGTTATANTFSFDYNQKTPIKGADGTITGVQNNLVGADGTTPGTRVEKLGNGQLSPTNGGLFDNRANPGVYYAVGYGFAADSQSHVGSYAVYNNSEPTDESIPLTGTNQASSLNNSVAVFTNRLTYASQQYINGETALTGDSLGVGQEVMTISVPGDIATATDKAANNGAGITSANREYTLVWTPDSSYNATDATMATSFGGEIVFNMPISYWNNQVGSNWLPEGTTIQGWVISSNDNDGYIYNLGTTTRTFAAAAATTTPTEEAGAQGSQVAA